MIKIAGCWDLGWNTPIKEIDLWEYPLRDFGVDELYMNPVTGIRSGVVTEKESLDIIIAENKDLDIIFVAENGDISLSDFVHPENALYIFGRANYSPFNNLKTKNSVSVRIETVLNKGMLWGHQAATIILYDRMIKDGNCSNR